MTVYRAGTTGPGFASACNEAVFSDSNGQFTISDFTACGNPTDDSQMYIVAIGGNASGCGVPSNTAIGLSAALGPANDLPATVNINEVTTIASVWALNQFLDATGKLPGASATNLLGLANAAMAVTSQNLADIVSGKASAPHGGVISPQAKLNTLADILAACVDTAGTDSDQCRNLMCLASGKGPFDDILLGCAPDGAQPLVSSTLEAAVRIARNPAVNVAELFTLLTPTSPFQPPLASAPTDWLLAVTYQGIGGLSGPADAAIDAGGNVWITNQDNNSVTKLDPAGGAISPAGGFTGGGLFAPYGIAIDGSGKVWVSNQDQPHSVIILDATGTPTGSPVPVSTTYGGISGIAVNSSGRAWVTNGDGTVSAVDSTGSVTPFPSGLALIHWVAIGESDHVWLVGFDASNVPQLAGLDSSGTPLSGSPFSGGGLGQSEGLAVDAAGNVWAANRTTVKIAKFDSSGAPVSGSPFSGGGLSDPYGIAIDGAGNAWIANAFNSPSTVTELNASGAPLSPDTGFTDSNLNLSKYDAIDSSGNVWVVNQFGNSVTEFIGPAGPIKTPLNGPASSP